MVPLQEVLVEILVVCRYQLHSMLNSSKNAQLREQLGNW